MEQIQKAQDGYFNNKLTDKKNTEQLYSPRNFGLTPAKAMKEATGVKSISPDRIATERSIQHFKDN